MPEEKEKDIRIKKLNNLKKLGINPYPSRADRTLTNHEVKVGFDKLSKSKKKLYLVGRIRSIRKHGGSTFSDLEDGSDRIQVYFKKDILGVEKYKLFSEYIDIGDFLQVHGTLLKTKAGEITLEATDFNILSKALQPLPEKWHGLKDIEDRFRKRYLDLIMNPDVKKRFIIRSQIIELLRQFLIKKGYLEVETPILQPIYGGGFAKPFITHHNALDIPLYLRISNELYLKRLLVGQFEKIFEFCRDFRNEGIDHFHNPEFTILEAMTTYQDYKYSMDLVEEMYEHIAHKIFDTTQIEYQNKKIELKRPWRRITMVEAVKEFTGEDMLSCKNEVEAKKIAIKLKIKKEKFEKIKTIGEIINLIFEEKVESELIQPTIIYDYPVEVSPLAKKCPEDNRFVERFEHFIIGKEQGNHYSELNDALELGERFIEEKLKIESGFEEAHQTDLDFIEAMSHGMPPATGIGIGIDRMVMLFTNTESIKEVIFFPTMKPKFTVENSVSKNSSDKIDPGINRSSALKLLKKYIKNNNLIKHHLATEAVMVALSQHFDQDKEAWAIAGLLHDIDWEETKNDPEKHGLKAEKILQKVGVAEPLVKAIKIHNPFHGIEPQTVLEKALFCTEELTGLITATALVQPDKKLNSVKVESVIKKFKDKSFARGVDREIIKKSEEYLNLPLSDLVKICLQSMQAISNELGL